MSFLLKRYYRETFFMAESTTIREEQKIKALWGTGEAYYPKNFTNLPTEWHQQSK